MKSPRRPAQPRRSAPIDSGVGGILIPKRDGDEPRSIGTSEKNSIFKI